MSSDIPSLPNYLHKDLLFLTAFYRYVENFLLALFAQWTLADICNKYR